MNPIKRIQYNSPVILTFALLSLAALALNEITKGTSNILLFSVYRSPANDVLSYLRIFTHVLGHASIDHYFNNFLIILLIGPMLEEKYGSRNMIFMILITALVTGILNMALFPYMLLGSSGVAFMLIILSSFVNLQKGRVPVTFFLVIIIFLGREIFNSIMMADNVSRITHIAGGVCGAALGFAINRHKLNGIASGSYTEPGEE